MIANALWSNYHNIVVKEIESPEVKWPFWVSRVNKKKSKDYSSDIVTLSLEGLQIPSGRILKLESKREHNFNLAPSYSHSQPRKTLLISIWEQINQDAIQDRVWKAPVTFAWLGKLSHILVLFYFGFFFLTGTGKKKCHWNQAGPCHVPCLLFVEKL